MGDNTMEVECMEQLNTMQHHHSMFLNSIFEKSVNIYVRIYEHSLFFPSFGIWYIGFTLIIRSAKTLKKLYLRNIK